MRSDVVILGLSCEFPGADTPEKLWETALLRRRWFRDIPSTRLGAGYFDTIGTKADTTGLRRAAVIEGYAFPQQRFALGSNDLLAADFTHWLALDCADRALTDSGLDNALPRDSTRVIVGNTLTGESSRAELLRLRWPYVRKTLEESGCSGTETDWAHREQFFKARLSPVDGRTLAGSLSNVIAGRIANHLDLRGGAYCIDAACASSLVAISQACSHLASHEIDCCLVGGVDISLDPLELVGFSVAGALADGEMKVFDRNRTGFLPGEGCGFAVLMRADHPAVAKCRVRAIIRGWSVSSDGRYDLTAPSADGQRLVLERTYSMAGYGVETVSLFEAHGTGTIIGDQVEISALNAVIAQSSSRQPILAAVSSIKANIGHTKAAAGMAGLVKAVMALETGILPPITGCHEPMPEFSLEGNHLRLLPQPEAWPDQAPRRAGVSGFGFGGVNAHITLEGADLQTKRTSPVPAKWQMPDQDAELFVFDGFDAFDLRRRIERVKSLATGLADAELAPSAAATVHTLKGRPWRAAAIASSPGELNQHLAKLLVCLEGVTPELLISQSIFVGRTDSTPRIGFLFPGQGGRARAQYGTIWTRFKKLFCSSSLVPLTDWQTDCAASAQSAIVASSTAGTGLLSDFGIEPVVCLGHSLGEISALHAGGVLSETNAVALARDRGRLMDEQPSTRGRMEILFTNGPDASQIVNGHAVSIAAFNSATETVITGSPEAIAAVIQKAATVKVDTKPLPVQFAFHSLAMQAVAQPFAERLRQITFSAPRSAIYSTVTGDRLSANTDFPRHLVSQLTTPVRFCQAFEAARSQADFWIEVGAGRVLCGLVSPARAFSIESESDSISPFLRVLAQCFIHGTDVRFELLYEDRRVPHFDLDWVPHFFTNPCERPLPLLGTIPSPNYSDSQAATALDLVRMILAERKGKGISLESIHPDQTLGPDLGVDSLGLTELTVAAEKALGRRASSSALKKMTVSEFAALFDASPETVVADTTLSNLLVPWVRAFEMIWSEAPMVPIASAPIAAVDSEWTIVSSPGSALPSDFAERLPAVRGSLLIHCAVEADEPFLSAMLAALRQLPPDALVVFLDSTGQFPGFAKSLALESPDQRILFGHYTEAAIPDASAIDSELHDTFSFREVLYDEAGRRFLPHCRVVRNEELDSDFPISAEDVVLVTGGAKGITAECMLALAERSGASVAIVGRSAAHDPVVLATRQKLAAMRVTHGYWSVDISDPTKVAAMVPSITEHLGSITSIVHGAGIHEPCSVRELSVSKIHKHCQAKVEGLRNLLSNVDPSSLKLLVSFGSVIARSGFAHSGAYALANDRLARLVSQYQSGHSSVRCLTLDWSAWRDTGMGVSLQAIVPLKAAGVDPIRTDDGVAAFLDAVCRPSLGARPILAGRLPAFPTVSLQVAAHEIDLPHIRVISHTPGVEIVADATVSLKTHSFLAGHSLNNKVILPGVLAVEFMVKVATWLGSATTRIHVKNVTFSRPIEVPTTVVFQIQAIRDGDTVYCRLSPSHEQLVDDPAVSAEITALDGEFQNSDPQLPTSQLSLSQGVATARDLYQHLLFHTGPFQIVKRYSVATARSSVFHLGLESQTADPDAVKVLIRDAVIHGIQICVPGELLLPAQIASIACYASALSGHTVIAKEVSSSEGEFTYNVILLDANGKVLEVWKGLLLRSYRSISTSALTPLLQSIHRERFHSLLTPRLQLRTLTKRYFEHRLTVTYGETNALGNVYYVHHLTWLGKVREMFLFEYAPGILEHIGTDFSMVTKSVHCEYERELHAFDRVVIRMRLAHRGESTLRMLFDYFRVDDFGQEERIARATQELACVDASGCGFRPLPAELVTALKPFESPQSDSE